MYLIRTDENGWVRDQAQKDTKPPVWIEVNKTRYDKIEPADPTQEQEAWHWNNGDPELRETGANIEPEPDKAKQMLLRKAERDWGYDPMQLNRIKRDYPILFDYISAEEYESAKEFLKRLHTEEGVIEYHELQWSLDMLEGRKSIELS